MKNAIDFDLERVGCMRVQTTMFLKLVCFHVDIEARSAFSEKVSVKPRLEEQGTDRVSVLTDSRNLFSGGVSIKNTFHCNAVDFVDVPICCQICNFLQRLCQI